MVQGNKLRLFPFRVKNTLLYEEIKGGIYYGYVYVKTFYKVYERNRG